MRSCDVLCGEVHEVSQWNLSNLDTLGTEESVLISEMSRFQEL